MGRKDQEEGRLHSLHMCTHAHVPTCTHIIYTHTYVHAHTYAHAHMYARTQLQNARTHVRTQPFTHARTYTTHARTHTCTHTNKHACKCTHAHVRSRTHTHVPAWHVAHAHTHVWDMYTYVYTHTYARKYKYTMHERMYVHNRTHTRTCTTHANTYMHAHSHTHTNTHAHMRTHAYVRTHTRVHTHVGAAHRARRPSHRLAWCLFIVYCPPCIACIGAYKLGFSNLGLVMVPYGIMQYVNCKFGIKLLSICLNTPPRPTWGHSMQLCDQAPRPPPLIKSPNNIANQTGSS